MTETSTRAELSKENTFSTHPNYWDCECEHNYIHPRDKDECKVCGSPWEEQPESRVNEVYEQLFLDDRPLTDETLKELGFENTMGGVIMKISDSITLDAVEIPDGELRVIIVDSYNGKNVTYWKTVGSVKMLIEALKGNE